MALHPTASELNFVDSMMFWLRQIVPANLVPQHKVVNSDEYEALANLFQDDFNNLFVILSLGEAHGSNQVNRSVSVGILTRQDPGNRKGLVLLDKLKEFIVPGLSIPFRDWQTGTGEVVSQMTILDAAIGPWFDEADDFRSRTLAFAIGYAQIWHANP